MSDRTHTAGTVRDDLRVIVDLSGLPLLDEAMRRGAHSEAALLIAPAADPEVWRARRRDPNYRDHPDDRLGDQHPGWVLSQWDRIVREHLTELDDLDHSTTLTATVERAAAFLGQHLTDLARDEVERGQASGFGFQEMGEEIHDCRRHLEDVVREGMRNQSTRIRCIDSADADSSEDGDETGRCVGIIARLDLPLIGLSDDWYCTTNHAHRYDQGRLNMALHQQLHSEGADRWVTVAQARQVIPRPEQTMRAWIRGLDVASQCLIGSRRIVVWWPDVHAQHIASQTRATRKRPA